MKKVLIISYNFPPVGGAGVQRPVKFVKYLRNFGWEPIVLSVANPSVPVVDSTLLLDIPNDIKIYRAKTFEPSYALKKRFSSSRAYGNGRLKIIIKNMIANILLPDLQILWWPDLTVKLIRIILKEKPNILFVSGPPFSSFVPVVAIAKLLNVASVLDYRDEWEFAREHWENSKNSFLARKLDITLEGYVIRRCKAFVAANRSYVNSIYNKHKNISNSKGYVVTNGYDEDDFSGSPEKKYDNNIKIVYAGTVWRATSLKNFMIAINDVFNENVSNSNYQHISIAVFGRIVDEESCNINNKHIQSVNIYGYTDHSKVITEIRNADILLLTLSDLHGSDKIIAGKIFEYMATGNHILAMVPNGETKNLLFGNYDNVTFCDPNSIIDIKKAIIKAVSTIDIIRERRGNKIPQFTRKKLTQDLSEIFNKVVDN